MFFFFHLDFKDLLPEIIQQIEEACFISFDGEFTGLSSEQNILPFDSSKEYYEKQLATSNGFILVQLGLTIFKKDVENPEEPVKLKSYNIYTFPQSKLATFSCQGQSLSFLAENGFDFNKLFTNAISYSNSMEEDKLRTDMNIRQEYRKEQLKIRTSSEEQDISNRNFLPVPENEMSMIENARDKIQKVLNNELFEVSFEKVTAYQRKLIYELIEQEFNKKVSTITKNGENNRKILVVQPKRSFEDELKLENDRMRDDEAQIIDKVGLRHILKAISSSKKLIVGHNCLLDIMYLINQCFEDLPQNYDDFKKLVHEIFPLIIDTKFIANSDKFKEIFPSSVLNQVYERLQSKPFKTVPIKWQNPFVAYNLEFPKEHEAGYDSFLTGYCFLVILDYLNIPLVAEFDPKSSKELMPFLNRIALQRIAIPYINVVGKEPTPNRSHVFYISFPQTWQTSDIQDHFKAYGPIQISWAGNTNAFVSLYNKEFSSCVVKTIAKPGDFQIKTLADFYRQQEEDKEALKRKKQDSDSETSNNINDITKPMSKRKKKNAFKECNNW